MVNISIDVTDLGGKARPGDRVTLWSPRVAGSASRVGGVVSTAPVTAFLTEGKATVSDVEPGDMRVLLQCRGVESQGPIDVTVPDGTGTVTLRSLIESQFEYAPPIVSAVQEAAANASASEEAAIRAQVRSEAAADRADAKVDDAINDGANLIRNEVKQDADRAEAARKGAETIQQGLPDKIGQELEAKLPGELDTRVPAELDKHLPGELDERVPSKVAEAIAADRAVADAVAAAVSNVGGRVPLVQSHEEGKALPAGSVYALPSGSVPEPEPEPEPEPGTDQSLISPASRTTPLGSERISDGLTTIVNPHGEKAGVVVTALATKASGGQRPQYRDAPTTVLMEPYWKGTLIGHIVATPNDSNLTIDFGDTGIQGIAASVFIEGITVDQLVVGEPSDREKHGVPTEILAPRLNGQALAFFFERTTAQEHSSDITFNRNWQPVELGVGLQTIETVAIAVGGPSDAIATYPNPQALNGIGVQVGIKS